MRYILASCFSFFIISLSAQNNGFEFGKITYEELDMKTYDQDSSAEAVVLNEFGYAFFDLEDLNKIYFRYHTKIKILKEGGKKYANFEILLRKSSSYRLEVVRSIKASAFNREGNSWKETPLQQEAIFSENYDKDWSISKFAVPNVRVGSVIDVYYELESPYTYNFVPWHFQSDIPKIKSEFWAQYPAYYQYHITLKGYLQLKLNENEVIKSCVGSTSPVRTGSVTGADCSLFKFGMENIPAFKEEAFMTAKRNFISAINFELEQITQRNGIVDKVTNEWKDAEQELKERENFGVQIKRARNLYESRAREMKNAQADPVLLAKEIHDYFKGAFTWNGDFGFLTDKGVKKAQEEGKGNVADINLSMLGALLEAGIYAEPVLLSTRSHGLPIKLYPVLSDFNYVLVRVKISDKYYFLDATNSLYPFGFIPERCLNGQGRALGETRDWIDLKPNDKERTVSDFKIKMDAKGQISGLATITSYGYAALNRRRQFFEKSNPEEYVKDRTSDWNDIEHKNFTIENEREITKPFIEKFELSLEQEAENSSLIYFPLFLFQQTYKNPFVSTERNYPVDFGAPTESVYLLSFEFPEEFVVDDLPQNAAAVLPNGGGKHLFNISSYPGKLSVASTLSLSKPVYTSEEYHSLREVYARYISIVQSIVVLKKSK